MTRALASRKTRNCGVSFAASEVKTMPKKKNGETVIIEGSIKNAPMPKTDEEFQKMKEKALRELENKQLREIMKGN